MTLSRDEAALLLEPYSSAIGRAVSAGPESYDELPSAQRLLDTKRTRSSSINDRMVHHALTDLATLPGVRIWESDGWIRFVIKDTIVLRFKKLTGNLNPASASTLQARLFVCQTPIQLSLAGLELTNLIAGYKWNDTEIGFSAFITCPAGPLGNRWVMALSRDPGAGSQAPPVSLPSVPPGSDSGARRITPKRDPQTDRSANT